MTSGRFFASLALVMAVSVAVSACGRRPGSLDTPYQAAVDASQEAIDNDVQPVPPQPAQPVRDRPFILDRLI